MGLIGAVAEVLTLTSELAASLGSRPNRVRKYEKSCSSNSPLDSPQQEVLSSMPTRAHFSKQVISSKNQV